MFSELDDKARLPRKKIEFSEKEDFNKKDCVKGEERAECRWM